MTAEPIKHVLIVGGGASGVLLACHLLKNQTTRVRVTLIEKRPNVGLGIAYGTANRKHLLNVRASNMSAYPEDPDHFWRWLVKTGIADELGFSDPFCFVPRPIYGQYIASLLGAFVSGAPRRLCIVQGECVDIAETRSGVTIALRDGSLHEGDFAVLATGNEVPPAGRSDVYVHPWSPDCEGRIGPDDTVLILGTGLTMVDHVLTLVHAGHRGKIIAMSRRGQLPQAHRRVKSWSIARDEIPFGQSVPVLLRWMRDQVRMCERQGGNWRSVIDGLRPYTQEIWQRLPSRARRRFLEHARTWWDVHRHRMAPEVEEKIGMLIAQERLTVVAGRVVSVDASDGDAHVHFRRRGATAIESMSIQRLIDCRGLDGDLAKTSNPTLRSLIDRGLGRPDPFRIGLEVTSDCAILDGLGKPSERLFAVGPLTRAVFWEIIAVPDIRVQCARVADLILESRVSSEISNDTHDDTHVGSSDETPPQSESEALASLMHGFY